MRQPRFGYMRKRILTLALCTLMVLMVLLPCASLAGAFLDPGIPFTFRGLQFLPVAVTDDPELIARESTMDLSGGWVLLVRVSCLDGPVSADQAELLRDSMTVFEKIAGQDMRMEDSAPREIILPGESSAVFDLIIHFSEKFDTKHIYLDYIDLYDYQSLVGLPEPESPLILTEQESVPAAPVTLAPTPTPEPTPVPSPTPPVKGMTKSQRNKLVKKVKAIMKDESMTYPRLPEASYLNPVEGRVLIALFDSDGKLSVSTLDDGFDHSYFKNLNRNRLAFSWKDAKTWILIYPQYKYFGKYSDGTKGYTTYTRIAVVYKDRIQGFNITTDDPPASVSRASGAPKTNTYGAFDIYTALQFIRDRLK